MPYLTHRGLPDMADIAELLKQAGEKREVATRTRRWAWSLSYDENHARMIQQAEELEIEARELERRAARGMPPAGSEVPPVEQQQPQQQQQYEAGPRTSRDGEAGEPDGSPEQRDRRQAATEQRTASPVATRYRPAVSPVAAGTSDHDHPSSPDEAKP